MKPNLEDLLIKIRTALFGKQLREYFISFICGVKDAIDRDNDFFYNPETVVDLAEEKASEVDTNIATMNTFLDSLPLIVGDVEIPIVTNANAFLADQNGNKICVDVPALIRKD